MKELTMPKKIIKNHNAFTLKCILLLSAIIVHSGCMNESQEHLPETIEAVEIPKQHIVLNNKGVGQMGYFDYSGAAETFLSLAKLNDQWAIAQQNLAIALLNRQEQGDEEKAIAIAEKLVEGDANNLVGQYIIAILKFNQGLCDQALPRFEHILKYDSQDAYALYFAGQCHLQNGNIDQALNFYQKAIGIDGYLRSAYYGGFMAAQRSNNAELAQVMLNDYQKLAANPKARLAEIKYTRMGPKATAQTHMSDVPITVKKNVSAPFFKPPEPLTLMNKSNLNGFGVVDLKQQGQSQLYVLDEQRLQVYSGINGSEQALFTIEIDDSNHQVAWADINNDGLIDVYITGQKDQLYFQNNQGFEAVDMQAFGFAELSSSVVRLADADHDGDIDLLLLSQQGVFEIWNNNLNNTFTALSSQVELPRTKDHTHIFIEDVDKDRDADIILQSKNSMTTLLNDRMWRYEAFEDVFDHEPQSFSLADNNMNGIPEINVLFVNGELNQYEFDVVKKEYMRLSSKTNIIADLMLLMDVDGDAKSEYLFVDKQGIKVTDTNGQTIEQILVSNVEQIKVLNTENGPELLLASNDQISIVSASSNRLPFILFNLSGKEDDANSVRSNHSGIGTNMVVYNGEFYSVANSFHNLTGLDQDYQATSMAAGNKQNIDFIGINWSDGVYQTEIGLKASKYHKITETQRQLSSCPVIFAWNNGQYEFVSDVLGVGGIGFAVGREEYGEPRPWENYVVSAQQMSSYEGLYKIQFTEPMEESAYLDTLNIKVVDVPQQWSVVLDERMQISDPVVTGDLLYYRELIEPSHVWNKFNKDVTDSVRHTDKKAINIDNKDHRFLGLVEPQQITMDFADDLAGDYHLIMNGWVEYGYSQTMFAAWQAGLKAQAPTIQYLHDGEWKTLLNEFGYPAGMPRSASVPLFIPEKTRSLRILTNMEVYFDQLALFAAVQAPTVNEYNLTLHKANLYQLGFPKRNDNRQRVPEYEFGDVQPFWDTRYMEGAYSRLGDITPLVRDQDNALAIIGAGEAIELSYHDTLPTIPADHKRYFILQFKGWAKDMDILTKDGETLAPIPADGALSEAAKTLNNQYNTRFQAGR